VFFSVEKGNERKDWERTTGTREERTIENEGKK